MINQDSAPVGRRTRLKADCVISRHLSDLSKNNLFWDVSNRVLWPQEAAQYKAQQQLAASVAKITSCTQSGAFMSYTNEIQQVIQVYEVYVFIPRFLGSLIIHGEKSSWRKRWRKSFACICAIILKLSVCRSLYLPCVCVCSAKPIQLNINLSLTLPRTVAAAEL